MTKLKIAPYVILLVKLTFSFIILLPASGLYFFSIFYPLTLVFVGENNQFLAFLAFLGVFILHVVFVLLYSYGKKTLSRIFGIGTIILLIADVVGFISMFPNIFSIIGVIIDVVCILLITLSLFDKVKVMKLLKKTTDEISNGTEDSTNASPDVNPYKR